MLKGCAIASVTTITFVLVSFAMVIYSAFSFFSNPMSGGPNLWILVAPAVAFAAYAITKIALGGRQRPRAADHDLWTADESRTLTFEEKKASLFHSLPVSFQSRHLILTQKVNRLQKMAAQAEDVETQAQLVPGLEKLQWLHLKNLIAHLNLSLHTPSGLADELKQKISDMRQSLTTTELTEAARNSKESTLAMTEERLRALELRRARLRELESDLERIEAQLDLSLERAALQTSPGQAALQLDLAERMVESADLFGSSLPMVNEIDAHFQQDMER